MNINEKRYKSLLLGTIEESQNQKKRSTIAQILQRIGLFLPNQHLFFKIGSLVIIYSYLNMRLPFAVLPGNGQLVKLLRTTEKVHHFIVVYTA